MFGVFGVFGVLGVLGVLGVFGEREWRMSCVFWGRTTSAPMSSSVNLGCIRGEEGVLRMRGMWTRGVVRMVMKGDCLERIRRGLTGRHGFEPEEVWGVLMWLRRDMGFFGIVE